MKDYPFTSRYFETGEGRMHYVDEGQGQTIVLLHGNPTWSYEHRVLIRDLRRNYRCVAVDYLGYGLSDRPPQASYLPQWQAGHVQRLLESLELQDITLVVHDWGGPIGMSYALAFPHKIRRLIVYNTWCWSVRGDRTLELFSALMGGPIGRFLSRHWNFFTRVALPQSLGRRQNLSKEAHRIYMDRFPTPDSRKPTWVMPGAIVGQGPWLESLWSQREKLRDKPFLFLWGMRDRGLNGRILRSWEAAFPNHTTVAFEDIGHFTPEELGARAVGPVREFLNHTVR